jgi:GR25 family glycosyltransferase involved in LPS biosynthesis
MSTTNFVDLTERVTQFTTQSKNGAVNHTDAGLLVSQLFEMISEHRHVPINNRFFYDNFSIVAYGSNPELAFDKSVKSMESLEWDEGNLHRLKANQHFSIPKIYERFAEYSPSEVGKMVELLSDPHPQRPITVTMTSCKRFSLFQKTVNSFLNCCLDKHMINKWIVIDDNSDKKDRKMMKKLYPFISFVLKKPEDKGHPRSMNILQTKVKTPYYFHIEDDWCFFRKEKFFTDCMNVLEEDPKLGQCLLNIGYSEDENFYDSVGPILKQTKTMRYYVHQFLTGKELDEFSAKTRGHHCLYWPHYSLRVGLNRTKIWEELGLYNEKSPHFEMDYAYRYIHKGYKTAFLDNIFCYHIGRKTTERNDMTKLNAYDLNNETQFGDKKVPPPVQEKKEEKKASILIVPPIQETKVVGGVGIDQNIYVGATGIDKEQKIEKKEETPPIKLSLDEEEKPSVGVDISSGATDNDVRPANLPKYDNRPIMSVQVINLKRREDRRKTFAETNKQLERLQYQFFEAVDGKEIVMNQRVCKLFETGDFNYRRGMIGCAMSHIKIWAWLAYTESVNSLLILEDDAVVCPDFEKRFSQAIEQLPPDKWDVLFLGHHLYPQYRRKEDRATDKYPVVEQWNKQKCEQYSMGGTAGYFISKRGAINLLKHILQNGVTNGIDWLMFKTADNLSINYCYPHIVYSECPTPSDHPDSDIQYDGTRLPVNPESWMNNDLEYWKKKFNVTTPHYIMKPNTNDFGEVKDDPTSNIVITNMIPDKDVLLTKTTFIRIDKMTKEDIHSLFTRLSQLPVKFYSILKSYVIVISQIKVTRDIEAEITFDGFLNLMNPV